MIWGGHDGEQGSASGARRIGQGKRVGERPGCMVTAGICERVCPGGATYRVVAVRRRWVGGEVKTSLTKMKRMRLSSKEIQGSRDWAE